MVKDLTGQRFGRWIVLNRAEDYISPKGHHVAQWHCKCDCGNHRNVLGSTLRHGKSKSCGCLQKEIVAKIGKSSKRHNFYDLSGEYGVGYTSKGEEFYFDLEDYNLIKDYCWHIREDGYVGCTYENKCILFHRLLYPESIQVDHSNHKKYDNRKFNLRPCNNALNQRNKSIMTNNTSGITGVNWRKDRKRWEARIKANGKVVRLGYFKNFEDAIKARKIAEEKYFGEWSYDNSMKEV